MLHFYRPLSDNQYDTAGFDPEKADWRGWVSWTRWLSYYNQINELLKIVPRGGRVLELGPGEQFTTDIMRRLGYEVVTLDHDPALAPDLVCDIREIDLPSDSFDAVLAFQVLEHVPYGDFARILRNLNRITKRYCVISLPASGPEVMMSLRLPRVPGARPMLLFGRPLTIGVKLALPQRPTPQLRPKHQWEIGKLGFPARRIRKDMRDAGFAIRKSFHMPQQLFFTFFVLEKCAERARKG